MAVVLAGMCQRAYSTVPRVVGAERWGHCLAHRSPMRVGVTGEHALASQELDPHRAELQMCLATAQWHPVMMAIT